MISMALYIWIYVSSSRLRDFRWSDWNAVRFCRVQGQVAAAALVARSSPLYAHKNPQIFSMAPGMLMVLQGLT